MHPLHPRMSPEWRSVSGPLVGDQSHHVRFWVSHKYLCMIRCLSTLLQAAVVNLVKSVSQNRQNHDMALVWALMRWIMQVYRMLWRGQCKRHETFGLGSWTACLSCSLAGVSRSTTMVVAYLMTVTHYSWEECLNAVKAVRSFVEPNCGFQGQLQEYQTTQVSEVWTTSSPEWPHGVHLYSAMSSNNYAFIKPGKKISRGYLHVHEDRLAALVAMAKPLRWRTGTAGAGGGMLRLH